MNRTLKNSIALLTSGAFIIVSGAALAGAGEAGHGHDSPPKSSHHNGEGSHHQQMMNHSGMVGHEHSMESLAGKPGVESDVTRTINVTADDSMQFTHEPFDIKDGETIKFVVTNNGAIPHEFSIGTKDEHMEHGEMMMANPNMHHGPGGNAITVKPGETLPLIWTFENAWEIEAACNIPGHYQAGMHSAVSIQE
ncbi:cupredoxin domain-containing protein [Alkalimarinus alittae]|uniref:Cupredoxin family protein n=1 Tax=Alkalimarinus alittae TaxID=2961619 RepID=A0ABY6MZY0_9ALTE|nr:cupredoxin family protein [Alkalimarinus alittae]UZE95317.1 cupredoxin family protein [Alkalimarinus alittae]